MMKKVGIRFLICGISCILAFVMWTRLIQMVDVRAVGPNDTYVGFASINSWFHKMTGVHMEIYNITDWLGLVPVFICMIFGVIGLYQWVKRRNIFKVDCDIIFLGIYYIVVIAGYLIFEMVPIYYRPILIEGRLEASYPSSTTLLVLSVMPTFIEQVKRRWKDSVVRKLILVLSVSFTGFMVIGRLISGVHWLTDIIGGMLLSAGLFFIYKASVSLCRKEKR